MARVSAKTRTAFLFELTAHTGADWRTVERIGTLLLRHGATYKRYQEIWCSVNLDASDCLKLERKERALEVRIAGLCAELGLSAPNGTIGVTFSGDPRGCTVKLHLPDGYVDDFGQTGFCVPTS